MSAIGKAISEMTGEELALAARGGSLAHFNEIIARYEDRLFSFLLRRCATRADAEDVAQDAFLRAWQKIDRYDPRWRFSTWLFTIGARLAASRGRSDGRRRSREAELAAMDPRPVSKERDPGEAAQRWDGQGRVWALAAQSLNEEQCSMLWLRYAEDLSMREIAGVLGRTEVGVRVALFRARDALAVTLEREGLSLERQEEPSARRRGAAEMVERKDVAPGMLTPQPAAGGV